MRAIHTAPTILALLTLVACAPRDAAGGPAYAPHVDPADFQTTVDNPFFPLVPGTVYTYSEKDGGRTFENQVTVTSDTKVIMGVTCLVVHDVVRAKGVVREDTYDWYAQDKQGTVWCFGEDTKELSPRGTMTTEGSWTAGVGRNQPGIIMPANLTPGAPYRQEYGPGHAEDMGQVVAVGDSVNVPFGSFAGCVRTREWSLLEPGTEQKWYARGVGLVRERSGTRDWAVLVSVKRP